MERVRRQRNIINITGSNNVNVKPTTAVPLCWIHSMLRFLMTNQLINEVKGNVICLEEKNGLKCFWCHRKYTLMRLLSWLLITDYTSNESKWYQMIHLAVNSSVNIFGHTGPDFNQHAHQKGAETKVPRPLAVGERLSSFIFPNIKLPFVVSVYWLWVRFIWCWIWFNIQILPRTKYCLITLSICKCICEPFCHPHSPSTHFTRIVFCYYVTNIPSNCEPHV